MAEIITRIRWKCICTLHYCRQTFLNTSNQSEGWNVCFWEGARLSFGMPKNVGQAAIAPENLAPLSQVEIIRSQRSQIVKDTNIVKWLIIIKQAKWVTKTKSNREGDRKQVVFASWQNPWRWNSPNRTTTGCVFAAGRRTGRLRSTSDSTFNTQIVAKHSPEETATMRNLVGMANNLNQLTKLSHQVGINRTKNILMELLEKLKAIMNEYK